LLASFKKNKWLHDTIYLTAFFSFFYFLFLGSYPLFTPDEGRYSEVAREMLVTSDFVTPKLNGIPFLDKPILYYWLQALAIKLFGLKEWALRFWPVTIGISGCIAVYLGGRALFSRTAGIFAAIILATSPLYYSAAHYANLDLEIAVLLSISLIAFIVAFQNEKHTHRNKLLFIAYLFSGLAILTKGLIGLLFPILIIGSFILLTNRFKIILQMKIIPGLILICAITIPRFYYVQQATAQFFNYFFVLQQFSRFLTTAKFNNQTTIWFYAPIILIGFFPWTVFLLQAAVNQFKKIYSSRKEYAAETYIWLWFFIVFSFFSTPKSKTIGYILPTVPALALIIGKYLSDFTDIAKSKGINIGAKSFMVIATLVGFFITAEPYNNFFNIPYKIFPYLIAGGSFLVLSAIACYFCLKINVRAVFICLSVAAISFLTCFILSAKTINHKSMKPLAAIINQNIQPNDEIITYYRYYQDLPIYTEKQITITADWHADDIIDYDNWQRELWFHMKYVKNPYWLIEEDSLIKKWDSKNRVFLIVYADMYNDFVRNYKLAKNKIPESHYLGNILLNDYESIVLISNKS